MKLDKEELPHFLVTVCLEVHKRLGVGLPAQAYRDAVAIELKHREILFEKDVPFTFDYKEKTVDTGEKIDFIVEDLIILSLVAKKPGGQDDKERVNARLRLTGKEIGFLVNFQNSDLRQGIKRLIVGDAAPEMPHRTEPGLQGLTRSPVPLAKPGKIPEPKSGSARGSDDERKSESMDSSD